MNLAKMSNLAKVSRTGQVGQHVLWAGRNGRRPRVRITADWQAPLPTVGSDPTEQTAPPQQPFGSTEPPRKHGVRAAAD